MNQIVNTNNCVRKETLGWLKGYLDGSVKATVLGKIKDAACIDIGEQLFQWDGKYKDLISIYQMSKLTASKQPI